MTEHVQYVGVSLRISPNRRMKSLFLNCARYAPLHDAALYGETQEVERLLNVGYKVNDKYREYTALHEAAWHGHKEIIKLLISRGADVNSSNINNTTPLHLAILSQKAEAAELLLAEGADINAKNIDDETPLHIAAYGPIRIIRLLLERGANITAEDCDGNLPLRHALYGGRYENIELMISEYKKKTASAPGWQPVKCAKDKEIIDILNKYGHKKYVEQQLGSGIGNLHDRDRYGQTPIERAVIYGHIDVIKYALEQGMDVNARYTQQYGKKHTLLYYAYLNDRRELIKLLESRGAKLDSRERADLC